jgi:hypothetical protein
MTAVPNRQAAPSARARIVRKPSRLLMAVSTALLGNTQREDLALQAATSVRHGSSAVVRRNLLASDVKNSAHYEYATRRLSGGLDAGRNSVPEYLVGNRYIFRTVHESWVACNCAHRPEHPRAAHTRACTCTGSRHKLDTITTPSELEV